MSVNRFVAHARGRIDPLMLIVLALIVGSALRAEGANRWVPLAFAVGIVVVVLAPDGRPSKLKSYAMIGAMAAAYLTGVVYLAWYAWGVERSPANVALGLVLAAVYAYMGVALWRAMLASHRLAQTGVYERYKRRQTPGA